jgi:hypothetical protein
MIGFTSGRSNSTARRSNTAAGCAAQVTTWRALDETWWARDENRGWQPFGKTGCTGLILSEASRRHLPVGVLRQAGTCRFPLRPLGGLFLEVLSCMVGPLASRRPLPGRVGGASCFPLGLSEASSWRGAPARWGDTVGQGNRWATGPGPLLRESPMLRGHLLRNQIKIRVFSGNVRFGYARTQRGGETSKHSVMIGQTGKV